MAKQYKYSCKYQIVKPNASKNGSMQKMNKHIKLWSHQIHELMTFID